ncbi:triphosphoribosyl-dephospho-CoA synthase [uncultured Lamprocystis sp.]|uniref:triphosphoribosyl-dephospho-CoA synthase n=1 Tax=uncultured Lamprocystis sp. TaxID=543132 RepID=UPI0025D1B679|nr:triphosphoribosyl-dephospho-CoA synthase [uncultured Lamprocystis sp.]
MNEVVALRRRLIADAYRAACGLELAALKPGNVHRDADGHGMTVDDFGGDGGGRLRGGRHHPGCRGGRYLYLCRCFCALAGGGRG